MSKKITMMFLFFVFVVGCECGTTHEQPTRTETTVNIQSHIMDASAFDMEAVIAKLKDGTLQNASELEKFINEASGINNIDIDKDGKVDDVSVTEERGADGNIAMAVKAHPLSSDAVCIAEIAFSKNVQTGQVEITGAYPEYVSGYRDHYYHHTLTGSVVGDMMFYSWLFSPRPVFMSPYKAGFYGVSRPIMSTSQIRQTRTTYRTQNKVSPVPKTSKPSTYIPKTSAVKKQAATFKASDSKLSSRTGQAQQFKNRGTSTPKATARSFSKPAPRSAPRPAPKVRSFGGSSRSFGGSRKSSAAFKEDIQYLTPSEIDDVASRFYDVPLARWRYVDEHDTHVGVIVEDIDTNMQGVVTNDGKHIDLYDYASMIGATVQSQHLEIERLKETIRSVQKNCVR